MPDEVQWKLRQRMTAEFGDEIRAQQRWQDRARDLKRVVGIAIRQFAPIQFDDDRARC